ncbi:hypothetical protein ASZ78_007061 [Callipepla squamata]|uniref:Uncharacterized protein n=1 Tax=Callipepla squamata TaxID=9009 RepID=A0A226MX62_CALSU|nr:hypothetical protein ASZ78_007061 [Callipepla squamata]
MPAWGYFQCSECAGAPLEEPLWAPNDMQVDNLLTTIKANQDRDITELHPTTKLYGLREGDEQHGDFLHLQSMVRQIHCTVNMDLWFFVLLLGSGLSGVGANNVTAGNSDRRDETPIIAVMVALSSLLVIVFIIIVLYMLR